MIEWFFPILFGIGVMIWAVLLWSFVLIPVPWAEFISDLRDMLNK